MPLVGTGQTQNSMHGLEKTSRGWKKDPGNRVDEAKLSLQSGSPRETTGERLPPSSSSVFFSPRPLSSSSPSFSVLYLLISEGQSMKYLTPGTTLPNVEISQAQNILTSLFPLISQLHTFQTPVYIISSTSVLFEKMHRSSLLNKS